MRAWISHTTGTGLSAADVHTSIASSSSSGSSDTAAASVSASSSSSACFSPSCSARTSSSDARQWLSLAIGSSASELTCGAGRAGRGGGG